MYQKIFFFLFSITLLIGCRNFNPAKPGQGTVSYKVSYPGANQFGVKSVLFPSEVILVFKDEKAAFIATGGMGMFQFVDLLDYKQKKFTSLLIDHIHGNYACTRTADEIKANENFPEYKFEKTSDTKSIAGLLSTRAVVKDISHQSSFDIYYYDKIKFYYWNSPFKDFNYLYTQYRHTINGLAMNLEATSVDLNIPVDTNLFSVKGDYTWVNQKQFFAHLSEL